MDHRIGQETGGMLVERVLPGAAALLGLVVLGVLLLVVLLAQALRASLRQAGRARRWEGS